MFCSSTFSPFCFRNDMSVIPKWISNGLCFDTSPAALINESDLKSLSFTRVSAVLCSTQTRDHQDHRAADRGDQQWRLWGIRVSAAPWVLLRWFSSKYLVFINISFSSSVRSATLDWPLLSQKRLATWWKGWIFIDSTLRTVRWTDLLSVFSKGPTDAVLLVNYLWSVLINLPMCWGFLCVFMCVQINKIKGLYAPDAKLINDLKMRNVPMWNSSLATEERKTN